MKVNLKKIGAIVAGATILASSAAFAGLMFGSTTLVDDNGAPVAKVVVGSNAQPSDGVAGALIAGKMVSEAYKSQTLTAQVSGTATCVPGGAGNASGTCSISNEKARLEITVPGALAAGTWTGENLIGDFLNRELFDREPNTVGDTDSEYQLTTSDTSDTANPFTDGTGTGGDIGVSEVFLYRVDGGQFSVFQDQTITDEDAGNTYVEKQDLWIKGDNHVDPDTEDVVGRVEFLAYSLKFDGPGGDEFGIPECTDAEQNDFAMCKSVDAGDTDIDDATETHRVKIWFMGEQWIISEMEAPDTDTGDELENENEIVNGGMVKLAKEAIGGIINQGEHLPVDNLKFQLDDLEAHGDTGVSAILSILDANGNILQKDKVSPGQTKEFNVQGKVYRFHVYKVAPGYTFGAKWADVAIYSEELELVDGQELDQDDDSNPGYTVALGWKNMDSDSDDGDDVDPEPDDPDTLRTIIVYSDDIEEISSNGEEDLEEGEYLSIVQDPEVWKLSYKGLDLTDEDMASLKFELKTGSDKKLNEDDGPTIVGSATSACIIFAPYIEVKSGDTGSVFSITSGFGDGELSDDEFIIAVNTADRNDVLDDDDASPQEFDTNIGNTGVGAVCDDDGSGIVDDGDFYHPAGSVFMRVSPSSDRYGVAEYDSSVTPDGLEVKYDEIADGDDGFEPPAGGVIHIESHIATDFTDDDVTEGLDETSDGEDRLGNMIESAYTGDQDSLSAGDFFFTIAEKAGEGSSSEFVNYWIFGVDATDGTTPGESTFDFDATTNTAQGIASDDEEVLYGHATPQAADSGTTGVDEYYDFTTGAIDLSGPVDHGLELVEEGYVSERGSQFSSIDDDSVEFDMAHQLAHAQWFLAPATTSAADAEKTIVTLGEGESTTVSGVTVKVLEITEDVGACSSAGGAVSCTADMSGVSAVIMPNNAPSVTVAMPYTGNYGNLVILDSDAVGVNTLVSVGGDVVNSVTASLLQGSAVDWTAERKVVREVVQGSKIVVAGRDAADTLEAAQDFVSQVQKT
ncbi:MAG: hypothetical protein AB1324_04330 [Candidatus Micrarchaeota archaeon]